MVFIYPDRARSIRVARARAPLRVAQRRKMNKRRTQKKKNEAIIIAIIIIEYQQIKIYSLMQMTPDVAAADERTTRKTNETVAAFPLNRE